eukprot:6054861-Amphidinium_carterae.1
MEKPHRPLHSPDTIPASAMSAAPCSYGNKHAIETTTISVIFPRDLVVRNVLFLTNLNSIGWVFLHVGPMCVITPAQGQPNTTPAKVRITTMPTRPISPHSAASRLSGAQAGQ